jgi:FtsP/CotA-like multicopper oxidase with cupredoxin domain
MGVRFNAWTYNGRLPGPVLEACEGDRVTIKLTNHAGTSHGLDSHALRTDTMHVGPVAPDGTMTIEKVVDTPGAFMYHCAPGPVTDLHIKSGLNGVMIVYPRSQPLRPARELVDCERRRHCRRDCHHHGRDGSVHRGHGEFHHCADSCPGDGNLLGFLRRNH